MATTAIIFALVTCVTGSYKPGAYFVVEELTDKHESFANGYRHLTTAFVTIQRGLTEVKQNLLRCGRRVTDLQKTVKEKDFMNDLEVKSHKTQIGALNGEMKKQVWRHLERMQDCYKFKKKQNAITDVSVKSNTQQSKMKTAPNMASILSASSKLSDVSYKEGMEGTLRDKIPDFKTPHTNVSTSHKSKCKFIKRVYNNKAMKSIDPTGLLKHNITNRSKKNIEQLISSTTSQMLTDVGTTKPNREETTENPFVSHTRQIITFRKETSNNTITKKPVLLTTNDSQTFVNSTSDTISGAKNFTSASKSYNKRWTLSTLLSTIIPNVQTEMDNNKRTSHRFNINTKYSVGDKADARKTRVLGVNSNDRKVSPQALKTADTIFGYIKVNEKKLSSKLYKDSKKALSFVNKTVKNTERDVKNEAKKTSPTVKFVEVDDFEGLSESEIERPMNDDAGIGDYHNQYIILSCGRHYSLLNQSCYKHHVDLKDPTQAELICQSEDAHLVSFENQRELDVVWEWLKRTAHAGYWRWYHWTSGSNINGDLQWGDGSRLNVAAFKWDHDYKPCKRNKQCITFFNYSLASFTYSCSIDGFYVCEKAAVPSSGRMDIDHRDILE